jgi:hypothetical protein
VPVRLPFNSLRAPNCDWLLEPREVKPGLLVATTLLPNSDEFAAVRLVNVLGKTQHFDPGLFQSDAQPAVCLGPFANSNVGVRKCVNRIGRARSADGLQPAAASEGYGTQLSEDVSLFTGSCPPDPHSEVMWNDYGYVRSLRQPLLGEHCIHVKPIIDSLPA